MSWDLPIPPESKYAYSEPITIRDGSWGHLCVKVGYVKQHPEKRVIRLEKRWKADGGIYKEEKFNIKDGDDWIQIRQAVERLWPELESAPTATEIDQAIHKVSKETQLLELLSKYPEILSQIPQNADILSMPEEHKEALKRLLTAGGQIANAVISKLAEQPIDDIAQFVKLLEELKLSTINSLVTHVTSRTKFIEMFEKAIHNEESYERRGHNSIHNLLKVNMWLVNHNYAILHDDETLRNIIHSQWDKIADEEDLDTRPDFLCMVDPFAKENGIKKLVIIEIKRPTVKIKLKHIDQVMGYRTILHNHSGKPITDFSCYIVGKEIDSKLQLNDMSNSGFIVKTYTDFISEARHFYREYIKIIESESYAF